MNLKYKNNSIKRWFSIGEEPSFGEYEKLAYDNANDIIVLVNSKGIILKVNKAIKKILGYSQNEIIGKNFMHLKIFTEDFSKNLWNAFLKAVKEGRRRIKGFERTQLTLLHKKGGKVFAEATTGIIKKNDFKGFLSIIRDFSERRKMESALLYKSQDLKLVKKINEAVNKGLSVDEILNILSIETRRLFGGRGVTVYLVSEDKKYLNLQNFALTKKDEENIFKVIKSKLPNNIRARLNKKSIYRKVLDSKKPFIVKEYKDICRMMRELAPNKWYERVAPIICKILKIKSVVLIPLISDNQVIGLLDVSSESSIKESTVKRLILIAEEVTNAIKRRKTEYLLEQERYKLKEYFMNLPLMAYNINMEGEIVDVNEFVLKTLGYPREELTGKSLITKVYSRNSWNKARNLVKKLEKKGMLRNKELIVRKKNGEKLTVLLNADTIYGDNGKPLYIIATHLDVTEREEALKRVIKNRKDYFSTLKKLKGHIFRFKKEKDKIIAVLSEGSIAEAFNLKTERVKGMSLKQISPKNYKKIRKYYDKAFCGKTVKFEIELRGTFFETRIYPYRRKNNKVVEIIGYSQDITERKKIQDIVIKSEEKFRKIFDYSRNLIALSSFKEGIYVDVNDSFLKTLGYKKNQVIGKSSKELEIFADYQERRKAIKAMDKKNYFKNLPIKIQDSKNKIHHMIFSANIVKIRGEKYLLTIAQDITELKNKEKDLENSLKEKEVLLKELHHRVKNNLQIIMSMLNLQADNLKNKELFKILTDTNNRIKSIALIHDNLYLSKDLNRLDFKTYADKLIKHLFDSYMPKNKKIRLVNNVKKSCFDVEIAITCGLIINELLSNALKHGFKNKKTGRVEISLKKKGKKHLLSVYDSGGNFPNNLNFKNTESLGLQLVNTLVEQLNAQIRLKTKKGTKFEIIFYTSSKSLN